MNSIRSRRSLQLGTILFGLLLWTPRSQAQSCTVACDFEPDRTLLRADLWRTECDLLKPDAMDPRYFGPNVRGPRHFLNGVCLFERIARGKAPFAKEVASGLSPVESAIEELQKAQSTALLPSQRTTAQLFEGLLHCQRLNALRGQAEESMARRCYHRSAAKASLARVDLAGYVLTYQEEDGRAGKRFDQLLDEMLTCQVDHLHDRETASCGMLIAPSPGELGRIVDVAADQVLPRYFGEDSRQANGRKAAPPVAAMLSRRLREAEAASQGADAAFAKIKAKGERIRQNHEALAEGLCEGEGGRCLPELVGKLLAAYNAAIETAMTYAAFVKQSIDGLLLDENSQNVTARVEENRGDAVQQVGRLSQAAAPLETLKSELTRLAVDAQGTVTMRKACQLLFCDIYKGGGVRLSTACRSLDPTSPSRESIGARNPFCQTDPTKQLISGTSTGATATTVCRQAGFDPLLADCAATSLN